ncbi:hypothetical protein CLOSYM_01128 [[Clostridium] symbiosum ATCC 14940]|uniref:Uncharacterized protein n=1 Tax=[Clostridium] symbiosum ATCC 14940 TaxID=411472 RepID=A0ABC9U0W2_CLOSY|nr:hypothetical protein CLOSYM_01128 [[Clostridium] symbiosum ATCC 14940]
MTANTNRNQVKNETVYTGLQGMGISNRDTHSLYSVEGGDH